MSDKVAKPTSIRRRLLLFLASAAVLMVSSATAVTYWVALHLSNNAYDRSLLDPAFDIADNVRLDKSGAHVDLPQKALEALVYDQVDKVIFQVRSRDNNIVDGVPDLPPPPDFEMGQHRFFDATYHGEKIRIAALRSDGGFVVQVGETLHKRNRLVGEILVAELVSTMFVALGSIALAWFGVTRGLLPFERLRLELLSRTPSDMRSLTESASPVEIAPVINAFNQLLDHLRDANTMQVQERVGGDPRVGDADTPVVRRRGAGGVAEVRVQRDAHLCGGQRPLVLEVLGRRDDGDRLDHPVGQQLRRHPQGERRLARSWRRHGQEVPGGGREVARQRTALPGPQGTPSRGTGRRHRLVGLRHSTPCTVGDADTGSAGRDQGNPGLLDLRAARVEQHILQPIFRC